MRPEEIIGYNIKRIRREKGIKIETLSKHLNITKGRLSQIENGSCKELSINRIIKICELLEVDFFEITSKDIQAINIENRKNSSSHEQKHASPDLVAALMDEFLKRLNRE